MRVFFLFRFVFFYFLFLFFIRSEGIIIFISQLYYIYFSGILNLEDNRLKVSIFVKRGGPKGIAKLINVREKSLILHLLRS